VEKSNKSKDLLELELFSGTQTMSNEFEKNGYKIFTVDWNEKFDSSWHTDISKITTQDIIERFGVPNVVWIAFDCTTYSIAAISHHRRKNEQSGNLDPVSDYAKFCDECNKNVLKVLEELRQINKELIFFIENPRGGLGKMDFMKPYEKYKHLITYCKYQKDLPVEKRRMKPTNIWTNHPNPNFEEPCKNGSPCHQRAPRGSKTGTQGLKNSELRSMYPKQLCEHIVKICNEELRKDEE